MKDARMRHRVFWLAPLTLALLAACASSPRPSEPAPRNDLPSAADAQPDRQRLGQVRLELAAAYFGQGQHQTALQEVNQALAAQPDSAPAYSLRGLILAAQRDPQGAEASFRDALRLDARDGDILHNYGWFLCQQGRFAEADAQFEQAIAQPTYQGVPRTLMAQGVCHARSNKLPEAQRRLMLALEREPGNPSIALNLAEVMYRSGEYEQARFYIRRVNSNDAYSNAQTLWLAARIEHRLGRADLVEPFAAQLRQRHPQATETLWLEQGRWDMP